MNYNGVSVNKISSQQMNATNNLNGSMKTNVLSGNNNNNNSNTRSTSAMNQNTGRNSKKMNRKKGAGTVGGNGNANTNNNNNRNSNNGNSNNNIGGKNCNSRVMNSTNSGGSHLNNSLNGIFDVGYNNMKNSQAQTKYVPRNDSMNDDSLANHKLMINGGSSSNLQNLKNSNCTNNMNNKVSKEINSHAAVNIERSTNNNHGSKGYGSSIHRSNNNSSNNHSSNNNSSNNHSCNNHSSNNHSSNNHSSNNHSCNNHSSNNHSSNNHSSNNNSRNIHNNMHGIESSELKSVNKLLMLNNDLSNLKITNSEANILEYDNSLVNQENFFKKMNMYHESNTNSGGNLDSSLLSRINISKSNKEGVDVSSNGQKVNSANGNVNIGANTNTTELNTQRNNNLKKLQNNENNMYNILGKSTLNDMHMNVKYVESLNNQFNFMPRENRKKESDNHQITMTNNMLNFQNDVEKKYKNNLVDLREKGNMKKL
ncbi:conserved Plasmodium protein, unknown function [Plasmodium malariae]|uniref:Uncharacterized protein n=1 Tax=Plasmodium malariae TaxID=5858 RepID=A0A1A8X716_PLAMA|nr:conserved Plasmodium protein, unknown function [Plasmodium malariae]